MLREIALDLARNDLSGNIYSRRRGAGQAEPAQVSAVRPREFSSVVGA
jgi:hypothetical protein